MTLMEKFGHEWITWEPEVIRYEILATFKTNSISDSNWNKIQAARNILGTIGFWEEWHIFEKVIQAFNNNIPDFTTGQRCTISQLMAGVDIANILRKEDFSSEVSKYVAACFIDSGVMYTPPPLEFSSEYLAGPMYECLDCGKIERDDGLDGRCDFCTGRFDKLYNFNGKPKDGAHPDSGKNIRHFLTRDPTLANKRFDEVLSGKHGELSNESAEDVQAVKLMVAHKYMMQRRQELSSQLEELKSWVTH
jgi:hypothetical protein